MMPDLAGGVNGFEPSGPNWPAHLNSEGCLALVWIAFAAEVIKVIENPSLLTTKLTGDTASVDLGWSTDIHRARWSKWQKAVASECSDRLGGAAGLIAFPPICRAPC